MAPKKTKYRLSLEAIKQKLGPADITYLSKTSGYTTQTVRLTFKANYASDQTEAQRTILALAMDLVKKKEQRDKQLETKVLALGE